MEKIVKTYRKRLYDLTTANRSLLLLRLSSQQDLDINELNFIEQYPAFHIIEELLTEKKKINISPVQDPRHEKVQEVSSSLKKIQRKLAQISEERGLYECYVGWLFAEGKWKDGTPFRAPLLFFPVKLIEENNHWYLQREERGIQVNKSLLLAFSHYHDLVIHDDILEESFEEFSSDPTEFRTEIYEWLKNSSLEFLFSKDYFTNTINPFQTYKRQSYEDQYELGEMRINCNAVLGIYPQSGSTIASDYDRWLEQGTDVMLEKFFKERNVVTEETDPYKEDLMVPFSMDASQEFAVREVMKGKSIVIQGPPGSGKSETICNMISVALSKGKKVLVVSHKRAALEVVSKRLEQKGITDFYSLVHDVKFDQRSLYTKINNQIERLDEYQSMNNTLDTIYLEKEFSNSVKLLTHLNRHSEEFRNALFNTSVCGYAPHELYLRMNHEIGTIDLSDIYTQYSAKEIDALLYKISAWSVYASIPYPNKELWYSRIEMPELDTVIFAEWKQISISYKETIDLLRRNISVFTDAFHKGTIDELMEAQAVLESLHLGLNNERERNIWDSVKSKNNFPSIQKETENINLLYKEYKKIYKIYSFEQLNELKRICQTAIKKSDTVFAWIYWKLIPSDFRKLSSFANELGMKIQKSSINEIGIHIEKILSCEKSLNVISSDSTIKISLSNSNEWHDIHASVQFISFSLSSIEIQSPYLYKYLLTGSSESVRIFLLELNSALDAHNQTLPKVFDYFTSEQHNLFIQEPDRVIEWMHFIEQNLDDVYNLDRLLMEFSEIDRLCAERIQKSDYKNSPKLWNSIIQQSLFKYWIAHLELVYPILRSMNTLSWQQYIQDWKIHSVKRKELSLEMILGRLREQTYQKVVVNRLQNRVTYRDLQHQVKKKKRIWSVRKLMQEYSEEVFSLIPCWMMSPEQVSCVFPMQQLFDLVIIDEASQCYTEHSLPAIYRAKQVVIAGDSQQLPPSDLYRVRWENEEEEDADIEIDSLLDLGERYLSGVMLKGHYRSRYPELISFSNQLFYKNQLNYIPKQEDIQSIFKPLLFHKVNGVWSGNHNRMEAEEVVKITFQKIKSGISSIGIVCFNYLQAQCILDLLEEESIDQKISLPEELFVKNIENVQGDERDLIIFSVGYAPDKSGRFVMQFGSLNTQGGEKRMNVAVTRAREQVIVVSSILPQELKTDSLKHEGPQVLKDYLQYVWDCQQYDRTSFFARTTKPFSEVSTASKLLMLCKDHQAIQLQPLYPFSSLTLWNKETNTTRLIDTDDSAYQRTEFAKYWHFNKPLLLEQKGWDYRQIFSRMTYSAGREEIVSQLLVTSH